MYVAIIMHTFKHVLCVYVCIYTYCRYSLDEGGTWYRHQFHNSTTFRVYGMLTEPGEATTVFGIYGADASTWIHSWMIIRIDFSEILC